MKTRLIYGEEERLLPWAAERIGISSFRRDAHSIGLERDGILVGVVVFDTFSVGDCFMHVAGDGAAWLNKELLIASFAYPFIQLGNRRVTAAIASKNKRSLDFCQNIGFTREGLHPKGMPNDDLITLGLLRENCRFIAKEHLNG